MKRTVSHLKDYTLCVLPADKEGWFAVMSHGLFDEKGLEAVTKALTQGKNMSITKVKSDAKKEEKKKTA